MPFDGRSFKEDQLEGAIKVLRTARKRCIRGYCGYNYSRKSRLFHRDLFCMYGSIWFNEEGSLCDDLLNERRLAENLTMEVIPQGATLVSYGTGPLMKWFVVGAFSRAIKLAEKRLNKTFTVEH